jgi:hypothetical protein
MEESRRKSVSRKHAQKYVREKRQTAAHSRGNTGGMLSMFCKQSVKIIVINVIVVSSQ